MEQFPAKDIFTIGSSLERLRAEVMTDLLADAKVPSTSFDALLRDKSVFRISDSLTTLAKLCTACQLFVSADTAAELQQDVEKKRVTYADAGNRLTNLANTVSIEMRHRTFLFVAPDRAKYYSQNDLFGSMVSRVFPDADYDIREAGSCLATARGTGCVFHLMRVLERGLHEFGKEFDLTIEHTNWQPAIDQIQSKIGEFGKDPTDRPYDWKERKEYYSQAAANFQVFKDAWRNLTAHPRGKFTEEESENVLYAVKSFMQVLAERLRHRVKM